MQEAVTTTAARVCAVGPIRGVVDGRALSGPGLGSRKARLLLALLVARRPGFVPYETIAEVLWPAEAPAGAPAAIATLVSRLRRTLGSDAVVGGREGYRLGDAGDISVDLDTAADRLDDAEARLAADEPGLALAAAEQVRRLLGTGDVFADLPPLDAFEPVRTEAAALTGRALAVSGAAALALGQFTAAVTASQTLLAADSLDERAARLAMRGYAALGDRGRAVRLYAQLRGRLADELGVDPAMETQRVHLELLAADDAGGTPSPVAPHPRRETGAGLVGRAAELRTARELWNRTAAGRGGLCLVCGEAGIGKTRLLDELRSIARQTGGEVGFARCAESERSLFLRPVVAAAGRLLSATHSGNLLSQLSPLHRDTLAEIVPEVAVVVGPPPSRRRGTPEMEQTRAFDALTAAFAACTRDRPVLLALDDLHSSGRTVVDFLHYLSRRLEDRRLLIVATLRDDEGAETLNALAETAVRIDLGPLPDAAVAALAEDAGAGARAAEIMRRTSGHPLYVVEILRALRDGDTGLPQTLAATVEARVRRAGERVESLLRSASVLGARFDPLQLAELTMQPATEVLAACAVAVRAHLLVPAGTSYGFAHDLVREAMYATMDQPSRRVWHLRAADLLTDQPEAVAAHASAAGDEQRAARAWLMAADAALGRAAIADAVDLYARSLAAAQASGLAEVAARSLLGRGRAHSAKTDYAAAFADFQAAAALARTARDERVEALALRELGGEVPTGMGWSVNDCVAHLERALSLATSLADRGLEASLLAWLAVLAGSGMRFDLAVKHGERAVAVAQRTGDTEALACALDGRKTSLAYLGEVAALGPVIRELEPLLEQLGDLFRLHWAVFESSFLPLARGDWESAEECIERAMQVQRRSGYVAYAGWHTAHLGWIEMLRGRLDHAESLGRQALDWCARNRHAWCESTAGAFLGLTLLAKGDHAGARVVLEQARRVAEQDGAEAYRLRCIAPLALATGSRSVLDEADALLAGINAPPGSAFVLADHCYTSVALAWIRAGEPEHARNVLAPLLSAAKRIPFVPALANASLIDAEAAAAMGERGAAIEAFRVAEGLGTEYGMPMVAARAANGLAELAPDGRSGATPIRQAAPQPAGPRRSPPAGSRPGG